MRLAQRNLEAALEAYNQSLAIREQLAAQDPSNAQWRRGLAISFVRVSEVLPEDRRSEAVELVQRAFTILVELAGGASVAPRPCVARAPAQEARKARRLLLMLPMRFPHWAEGAQPRNRNAR